MPFWDGLMAIRLENEAIDGPLSRELESLSETLLAQCYQCGKCSAGCPVAAEMDMLPNQVMRLAQLGQFAEILRSETIWVCASCATCTTRCPREVEIAAVMDGLREMALLEELPSVDHGIGHGITSRAPVSRRVPRYRSRSCAPPASKRRSRLPAHGPRAAALEYRGGPAGILVTRYQLGSADSARALALLHSARAVPPVRLRYLRRQG